MFKIYEVQVSWGIRYSSKIIIFKSLLSCFKGKILYEIYDACHAGTTGAL